MPLLMLIKQVTCIVSKKDSFISKELLFSHSSFFSFVPFQLFFAYKVIFLLNSSFGRVVLARLATVHQIIASIFRVS